MTIFRPCIDLHSGQVKQIVGGSLSNNSSELKTNHTSNLPASHFANLYKQHALHGAHVIMLGPGNEEAAQEALETWHGGLQVGGGITVDNARLWIERGAEKVIVTSYLFPDAKFSPDRLAAVVKAIDGDIQKLVIDLSCRRIDGKWMVAMNKWRTLTDMEVNQATIRRLEPSCSEFLIHAADNEGLQQGIDEELVSKLSQWCTIPVTYAGGGRRLEDLDLVKTLSGGKVDLTIGTALDIFGGEGVRFDACVEWNKHPNPPTFLDCLLSAAIMKPVVSALNAWSCIVVSVFAIVILSVIGGLFKSNHHSMVGSTEDPPNGPAVAGSVFAAVIVYAVFLVFCGFQAYLHNRQSKRGSIALN
ncbi:MAG: hypothetical protein LQ346_007073 [Caloplaca aetnensis]|nr:MAG: hypothetical protein LQ346_007073 [Caloplaca aetnensis]